MFSLNKDLFSDRTPYPRIHAKLPGLDKLLVPDWSPETNKHNWLSNELSGIEVPADSEMHTWSRFALGVHGTTIERAKRILECDEILSHRALSEQNAKVVTDRQSLQTDQLDVALGLDKYVFLSYGKIAPQGDKLYDVFFCFPNQRVLTENTLVSFREIAEFGALVSPEGVAHHQYHRNLSDNAIAALNEKATQSFFSNLFHAKDFREELFPAFLYKNFEIFPHYLAALNYPGTSGKLQEVGGEFSFEGMWSGPQVMVENKIGKLSEGPGLVIVNSTKPSEIIEIRKRVPKTWHMIIKADLDRQYKNFFRNCPRGSDMFTPSRKIQLAMRDFALLARFNESGVSYKNDMVGFKKLCES